MPMITERQKRALRGLTEDAQADTQLSKEAPAIVDDLKESIDAAVRQVGKKWRASLLAKYPNFDSNIFEDAVADRLKKDGLLLVDDDALFPSLEVRVRVR